jgi:hypothetical protein
MTSLQLYQLFFLLASVNIIGLIVVYQVRPPRTLLQARKEREQFMGYMRQLAAEEAGRELLETMPSLRHLIDANHRLKQVLCKDPIVAAGSARSSIRARGLKRLLGRGIRIW